MIEASLLEFFRTGRLGPLELRLSSARIAELVGEPGENVTGSGKVWRTLRRRLDGAAGEAERAAVVEDMRRAAGVDWLWRYGDVELEFSDSVVVRIAVQLPGAGAPGGGGAIVLDPWIVRAGVDVETFAAALGEAEVEFGVEDAGGDLLGEGIVVRLRSGVVIAFAAPSPEGERVIEASGLCGAWIRAAR